MRIAELDRKITIKQRVKTVLADGQRSYTYEDLYANMWAKRIYNNGNEGFNAGQITATAGINFIIRFEAAVRETMIVEDVDGTQYNIMSVGELQATPDSEGGRADRFYRNRYMLLGCVKTDKQTTMQF